MDSKFTNHTVAPILLRSLSLEDSWELLWCKEGQQRWLGINSNLNLQEGSSSYLHDEQGEYRRVTVTEYINYNKMVLRAAMAADWYETGTTNIEFSISQESDGCILTVEETEIPIPLLHIVESYWKSRKILIESMSEEIHKRRSKIRQAVVLIHGIGEQKPGEMMNDILISGILGKVESNAWIKPDDLSEIFDLRKATVNASNLRPTTDIYEVYWAHLIRDTTLSHVFSWLSGLLMRWPIKLDLNGAKLSCRFNVPIRLMPIWIFMWLFFWGSIFILINVSIHSHWIMGLKTLAQISPILLLIPVVYSYLKQFLVIPLMVEYLGDAARYLRPFPSNIAHRQSIRIQGVQLLENLHKKGIYDRIIVVGHSLGSVIAYDIVTYAWPKMCKKHKNPASRRKFAETTQSEPRLNGPFHCLRHVEREASRKLIDIREAQFLQHEAWKEMRINTQPWLVTDLITIGSPLTYAEFLLTENPRSLQKLKNNRSLPICPPRLEQKKISRSKRNNIFKFPRHRFSYELSYISKLEGAKQTFTYYDFAALFAVVRWTNIYIPSKRFGLLGDIIGGPLGTNKTQGTKGPFGYWILDIKLNLRDLMIWPSMHTLYWDKKHGRQEDIDKKIKIIQDSLRLNIHEELRLLNLKIPAYSFLDQND